jgi:tRNA A37 threonylcarbamoyladenosine dehydratase
MDDVCVSNVNRQLHATAETIGEPKVEAMRRRVLAINPAAEVEARHAFFTEKTADELLAPAYGCVLDAIDSFRHKVLLIAECRRIGREIVVVGSAGGRRDAGQCQVTDLARTYRDALLQMVRKRLRQKHGFPKKGDRKFHIPAVFSPERPVYPKPDGSVCEMRPEESEGKSMRLSCEQGLGAATHVTGTMGFLAAGAVIDRLL